MAEKSQTDLQKDAINAIAAVSTLLRNAIAASLPVAPEQYVTIAIPGTVIDLEDADRGGSFVYNVRHHAVPPTSVRQAEARLVDGMMPISNIMIGNTGKSVARSYSRSLDGLLPRKATISSGAGIRSPGATSYNDAMEFLRRKDPDGRTVMDIYRDKQTAWGKARSAWEEAKSRAHEEAERKFPPSSGADFIGKQSEYINKWNKTHYYVHKTSAQSAWMDWVVNGQKYDVDYNFGLIDIDSIMGRIEASKESLRNSTIPDADGASEVYGVSLTPSRWATYCRRKAEGWYARNGHYTAGQVEAELARLGALLDSYGLLENAASPADAKKRKYPVSGAVEPKVKLDDVKGKVKTATSNLYEAQGQLAGAKQKANQLKKDAAAEDVLKKAAEELEAAKKNVAAKQKELQEAENGLESAAVDWSEYKMASLQDGADAQVGSWLKLKKETITSQMEKLKALLVNKRADNPVTLTVITGATAPKGDKVTPSTTKSAPEGSELANPLFGLNKPAPATAPVPAAGGTAGSAGAGAGAGAGSVPGAASQAGTDDAETADPWTTISFSFSATDQKSTATESSWGMKVGGSVGFGLWSVGGSYAHDESHRDMQSDMASCDVSVSFSALVVNINRPWLYGELFNDIDIEVAQGVQLSPGPLKLKAMIQAQKPDEINQYSQFPAYPTSFIVAADTTIEFSGATKHIEQHFDSHSNSGSLSVGYGPWSVSGGFHEEKSSSSLQMHTTATGCKLSFGAPQVIAWVSQILPALPRDKAFQPLSQGAGLDVPAA